MWRKYYARWMYRWETALTTRDSNRIVRPVEWGFEWLTDFSLRHGLDSTRLDPTDHDACERAMLELNQLISRRERRFLRLPASGGLRARRAASAALPYQCPPGNIGERGQASPEGGGRQAQESAISALYFPGAHSLSGKRPGQCPLVSGAPRKDGGQTETGDDRDAAMECGCFQP